MKRMGVQALAELAREPANIFVDARDIDRNVGELVRGGVKNGVISEKL